MKIIVFLVATTFSGSLSSTPRSSQCMHFTKTNFIQMYRLQKSFNRNNQMVMTSYEVYLFDWYVYIFYSYCFTHQCICLHDNSSLQIMTSLNARLDRLSDRYTYIVTLTFLDRRPLTGRFW